MKKKKKKEKDKDKNKENKETTKDCTRDVTVKADVKPEKSPDGSEKKEKEKEEFGIEGQNMCRVFVKNYSAIGLHGLRKQFVDMKTVGPPDPRRSAFEANADKCRYKDIPCWDRSRVILKWPEGASDFIHANRIKHDFLNVDIICTQGPLENTIGDFWRMVWQEKVKSILMLCQVVEQGKTKCTQYYPAEVGQEMSHFGLTITCREIDNNDKNFVVTKLHVVGPGGTEKLSVRHRNWVTWPDKDVPKSPMAPFRLLQHIRREKHPVIIHCSAGVGRTGTLVALELLYRSLQNGVLPDVRSLVLELRWQRSHSVQTEDQFLYLFFSLFQLCAAKHWVPIEDIRDFCVDYDKYLELLRVHNCKNLPMELTENLRNVTLGALTPPASAPSANKAEPSPNQNEPSGTPAARIKEVRSEMYPVDQTATANPTKPT
ncbi:unnamed protein product [Bursaphelenchus xylophilus]|uniref:(pine wood nematode) hypothetical protein n=1 Tax=Bursaphelenchus xylophilus TaxID=6326 RepID=A0A1I7RR99_BURXY|nr:unnamed protein product [Bursaphelenchus xylophilus]CAG9130887.1 unnamed protein product [Bursaphelenchus xylophilus]